MTARKGSLPALLLLACAVRADVPIAGMRPAGGDVAVTYPADPALYYILLRGDSVAGIGTPAAVRVPAASPDTFASPAAAPLAFYAIRQLDRAAPGDLDGDGMDDVYEVLQGFDAFDPADASLPAPEGGGLTNLDVYLLLKSYGTIRGDAVSREVSVINQGGASAPYEAVSREVSVVNEGGAGSAYEAVSREVSVYYESGAGEALEAVSREVSVWNLP